LAAALAILLGAVVAGFIHARDCLTELFLGFYSRCVHGILHGTRVNAAGKGTQGARSTTPALFTPLQAIYTRPSEVAAILGCSRPKRLADKKLIHCSFYQEVEPHES